MVIDTRALDQLRVREAIAAMNSSSNYEVIAGIAMILTGLFLGFEDRWGPLMMLLGILLLLMWLVKKVWML